MGTSRQIRTVKIRPLKPIPFHKLRSNRSQFSVSNREATSSTHGLSLPPAQ
jgi:hypothetical protein